jgi:hypothetical protein
LPETEGLPILALANANDPADYQTTTNYPKLGRWGNGTNQGTGTFQIVDLGAVYSLNGVGYNIDWDGAFKNSLTFRVEVSTDNKTWRLASEIVHPYSPNTSFNKLDIDVAIPPTTARYVKYWEPRRPMEWLGDVPSTPGLLPKKVRGSSVF